MMTPYGRRGAICEHYGWTWDYLHHCIPYAIVLRMMADAPTYDYDGKKKNGKPQNGRQLVADLLGSGRAVRM